MVWEKMTELRAFGVEGTRILWWESRFRETTKEREIIVMPFRSLTDSDMSRTPRSNYGVGLRVEDVVAHSILSVIFHSKIK